MNTKQNPQAMNDLLHKRASNKDVFNRFLIQITETTSIGSNPTPLNQVIPSVDFVLNSQPNETLQFLRNVETPDLWEKIITNRLQMLRNDQLIGFFCRDHA